MREIMLSRRDPVHSNLCDTKCTMLQSLNVSAPLSSHMLGTTATFHMFDQFFLASNLPQLEYDRLMYIVKPEFENESPHQLDRRLYEQNIRLGTPSPKTHHHHLLQWPTAELKRL